VAVLESPIDKNLGLIGFDLKQVIAAFAGENVQQRTFCKNGVAGEELQQVLYLSSINHH
jgi:hypothetical protein